uniref:Uncharacterized protein n=1 Tax=Eutreptiella gymnastica TaxID=73025 RepID=A0A7S4LE85_9EUGL|eukprot:CAMPEP_0174332068 /NCGR_PEP_ID=MMETSP0810-20121108/18002_1 /TAXON_ID=73025 ORGANISM="Eutreptiella gymnastica-like, Strain CCMP1594" /NCGR_SAMPLE_ID=MMETSP0810 /ASSEMBLY_ACC=CAM_ASM_000659 /LENGTH=105 /DNA_ID=CAMNT_0015448255 /DNA_START=121 /DNA_END=438 /DNA_ORIENTATION=-
MGLETQRSKRVLAAAGKMAAFRAAQERCRKPQGRCRNETEVAKGMRREPAFVRPLFAEAVAWLRALAECWAIRGSALPANICRSPDVSVMGITVEGDGAGTAQQV